MAIFNKFQDFAEQIGSGGMNLSTDVLKVYLSNSPPAITDTLYDIQVGATGPAEFAGGTGYTAGGLDVSGVWGENPAGTGELVGTDVTWTAAAADWVPFQYVVLYDETSGNNLIGWWDKGSAVTLGDGESFTVNFAATILTIT